MIKKITLLLLLSSVLVFADPIQLQVAPSTMPVQLAPIILTPTQATTLLTAIAGCNVITMPTGMTLQNLQTVRFQPITTGPNAGSLRLNIMATPIITGS